MADFRRINRDALVRYFQNGCKDTHTLGFELEHILLHREDNRAVSYTEPGGIRDILQAMAPAYREVLYDGDDIVGLVRSHETVSIEPAGQLEVSAGPFATVAEIEAGYAAFRRELYPLLKRFNLTSPLVGYHPSTKASDLALVPKRRYECMTEFLGNQAYSSICMMRGTAGLQVSVDYTSEEDALLKLRVAQKIAPLLALMCDNSAVFEGAPTKGYMARTGVWSGMKQDRVGTVPGSLSPAFTFADYADYIMTREAVLIPDANEEDGWRYVADKTFDELYADRAMTTAELEHALSMVWPDARLKYFVEIRPADALSAEYSFAYTAVIASLFYSTHALQALDEVLTHVDEAAVAQAKEALMADGYNAQVYGAPAYKWTELIMKLAEENASPEDAPYLRPLADLVTSRTTLATTSSASRATEL